MPTHKELITSMKFDESFKNTMRDYYSYGFKKYDFSDGTTANDWRRLKSILSDYANWNIKDYDEKSKIIYITTESRMLKVNPFQRVYRFCKPKFFGYYLHMICLLDDHEWDSDYLNREMDKLTNNNWPIHVVNAIATTNNPLELYRYIDDMNYSKKIKDRLKKAVMHGMCLKSSQIATGLPGKYTKGKDANRTTNNRLSKLENLGIIECEQGVNESTGKKNGDKYWKKRECSLDELIETGLACNDSFFEHFIWAVDFYSRALPLGEYGVYLMDRMGLYLDDDDYNSPFVFKNDYFIQALNDFNIIDLLGAIERGEWCYIEYKHGTNELIKTNLLCFPIEIRFSVLKGRQSLMYYDPIHRSCTSLRIEFIDKIITINKEDIIDIICIDGKDIETIEDDIRNSRELLKYVWGVSTSRVQENNVVGKIDPQKVIFSISVNLDTEYYILKRFERERRCGSVSISKDKRVLKFSAMISDTDEMKPWIRSYYSRILSCENISFENNSYVEDVEQSLERWNEGMSTPDSEISELSKTKKWEVPDELKCILEKYDDDNSKKDHEGLFNELFSVYSGIIVGVMENLCSTGSKGKTVNDKLIDESVEESVNHYGSMVGIKTKKLIAKEVKKIIIDSELIKKRGLTYDVFCKFKTYYWYKSLIPLTTNELRWLKTILDDKKVEYFFDNSEIEAIYNWIDTYNQSIEKFPLEKIVYYDRYFMLSSFAEREKDIIKPVLRGISDNKSLNILYVSNDGLTLEEEFKPITLEFSKLDDRFQLYAYSDKDKMVYTFNLHNIMEVSLTEKIFDRERIDDIFRTYVQESKENVVIWFYDINNLTDRLLTEFSPWEKTCEYFEDSRKFKLTIYYQKYDELDVVIRLMGYGANIQFEDKEQSVAKEILCRLERQRDISNDRDIITER